MALADNLFEAAAGEAAKPAPIIAPVPTAAETMKSRRDTRLPPKGFDSAIFASIPHVPLDGIGGVRAAIRRPVGGHGGSDGSVMIRMRDGVCAFDLLRTLALWPRPQCPLSARCGHRRDCCCDLPLADDRDCRRPRSGAGNTSRNRRSATLRWPRRDNARRSGSCSFEPAPCSRSGAFRLRRTRRRSNPS